MPLTNGRTLWRRRDVSARNVPTMCNNAATCGRWGKAMKAGKDRRTHYLAIDPLYRGAKEPLCWPHETPWGGSPGFLTPLVSGVTCKVCQRMLSEDLARNVH